MLDEDKRATGWTAAALAAAGLALTGPGIAESTLPGEAAEWATVGTDNFRIHGTVGRRSTVKAALAFERFHGILARVVPQASPHDALPTYVFLLGEPGLFSEYTPRTGSGEPTGVGGFCATSPLANYIAIDASAGTAWWRVIRHEYVHLFLNRSYAGLPPWIHEGLAEYLSAARISGNVLTVGLGVDPHLERLRRLEWLPLDAVFSMTPASLGELDPERRAAYYAQVWLLSHFLFHDGGGRAWPPGRLLELRDPQAPIHAVLLTELGLDTEGLEARLHEYAWRERLGVVEIPVQASELTTRTRARPGDVSRVLVRLGELLLFVHEDREAAERHFRAATRIDPGRTGGWTALGYLRQLDGAVAEAEALFARASSLRDDDARRLYLQAQGWLEQFERDSGEALLDLESRPDPRVLRARRLFERSLAARPDRPDALAGLGATYLYDPGQPSPGIAAIERALELAPGRVDFLANLAVLHAQGDSPNTSRELLARLERQSADRRLLDRTRELVLAARQATVRNLLERGDWREAKRRLDALLAETTDPGLRSRLELLLLELRP